MGTSDRLGRASRTLACRVPAGWTVGLNGCLLREDAPHLSPEGQVFAAETVHSGLVPLLE